MMMNKYILASLAIFVSMVTAGCVQYIVRYDGPYEGIIVDSETRVPIEGVVVLGVWYKEAPTVAGAVSSYYDARETVTDRNGDFRIPGKGLRVFSDVAPIDLLIFKAGYEYIGLWPWDAFKNIEKISWEGGKPIIPLKKMTLAERNEEGSPDYPSEPPEQKIRLMLEEINKDRAERGLNPVN